MCYGPRTSKHGLVKVETPHVTVQRKISWFFLLFGVGALLLALTDPAVARGDAASGPRSASKSREGKSRKTDKRRAKFDKDRAAWKKKFKKWKSSKKYRGCRFQRAKGFLKRSSFVKGKRLLPGPHRKAVKYRAEHYGFIPGLKLEAYHPVSVHDQIVNARFFGKPIQIHEKLEPALICVEKRVKKVCNKKKKSRYIPQGIGGLRVSNTYRGGEISNHMFGIAIDIDSNRNPCCGCVDPWPNHPQCKKKAKSHYDRVDLTKCWVDVFEKYGFYWLGRDDLQDYMHFEFLGDPDKILP